MTSLVKPPKYARPFPDRTAEPDSPHGADMAQAYAQQTDNLVWACSGATRSWVWPYFRYHDVNRPVPLAQISAADTWTTFYINSVAMEMPWRFTEGFEKILIYTGLVSDSNARLKVRWDSQTLVDAVATATGEVSPTAIKCNNWPDMMSWDQLNSVGGGLWLQGSWYSWLTPNVPANRRIKLVPYVKAPDADERLNLSITIDVWMVSLVVMDVAPKDSIGW